MARTKNERKSMQTVTQFPKTRTEMRQQQPQQQQRRKIYSMETKSQRRTYLFGELTQIRLAMQGTVRPTSRRHERCADSARST